MFTPDNAHYHHVSRVLEEARGIMDGGPRAWLELLDEDGRKVDVVISMHTSYIRTAGLTTLEGAARLRAAEVARLNRFASELLTETGFLLSDQEGAS